MEPKKDRGLESVETSDIEVNVRKLKDELHALLATSYAVQRKKWAKEIDQSGVPLRDFFLLWHGDQKTAQRFMWLIGDICDQNIDLVRNEMEFLFSIRNQFTFAGMDRSVAKWLWLTGVPSEIEIEAGDQLVMWMEDTGRKVACHAYASQALFLLASENRIDKNRLLKSFSRETLHNNKTYARRISRQLAQLFPELDEV